MKNIRTLFVFLVIVETVLVSCGKQDTSIVPNGKLEVLTTTGTTSVKEKNKSLSTMISSSSSRIATSEKVMKSIKDITTLDGVSKLNPQVLQDPKKEHPRFIELQKKQMLL